MSQGGGCRDIDIICCAAVNPRGTGSCTQLGTHCGIRHLKPGQPFERKVEIGGQSTPEKLCNTVYLSLKASPPAVACAVACAVEGLHVEAEVEHVVIHRSHRINTTLELFE